MIGLIEPTKSEIIGNGYYVGGPHWKIVDTSPTKFYRRVYNKIKIGIKNHIAKSSDESLRISRFESKRYAENLGRAKRMARARDAQRYADRYSTRAIKVRKFD
jgi:hypothetical protein